jgi:PAS domain S-box-containing protein
MEHVRSSQPLLLGAAVDLAPVGMAILDRDLRYLHINPALAELNGATVEDHIGRRLEEMLPADVVERVAPAIREVLATGESRHGIAFRRGTPEDPRALEASYFPVNGNAVGALVLDMTERDLALARARFLARASAALGSSLDLDATLQTVAQLAVPEVADWAFVELVQPDGSIARRAWAHADPSLDEIARDYDRRYPLDPDDPAGSAAVIRTGEPELVEDIPEGFYETVTHDPEQLRILRGMGFRSYVIVPLIARGRVIGDLALAHSLSGRRYGTEDLEMLRALADACAMAIDNARLFGAQQATARTLQRSLLPRDLPEIEGVELAARYRPYASGIEVGGDFYDVFSVPGGWTLAIGDVAGKGAAAAATTALLRHTLRIAAHLERSPVAALARMDEALLREDDVEHPASAVCGLLRVRPDGCVEIALAAAGHPPPYVRRRDGRVEDTVRPGALLGALPGPVPTEMTLILEPGDVLVLYTDGVTEARGPDGQLGEAGLAIALAHAEPGAAAVAEAIEHRAVEVQDGRPSDDIAVLAIGVPVADD